MVSVDDRLAGQVAESARRHGLTVEEYVARVLQKAETLGTDHEERALEKARADFEQWNADGRPETGAMSLDEVFAQ